MAIAVDFYAGPDWTDITSSSGLGFFGASFGSSVQVGQYQDSTYITTGNGGSEGPAVTNAKYIDASGATINSDVEVHPSSLELASGTINVRFVHDAFAVMTQAGEFRIFDRSDPNTGAVGVVTEICQLINGGSGVGTDGAVSGMNLGWTDPAPSGSGAIVTLLANPGTSGLAPSGIGSGDIRHDWYFLMSAKPTSIGPKIEYGLYVELEYL